MIRAKELPSIGGQSLQRTFTAVFLQGTLHAEPMRNCVSHAALFL